MARISLIEKTHEIERIILEPKESCFVINCDYGQDCAGKKDARDNGFRCDLKELILLYKNAPKKIIK